ncbi:FKBP-type peptidyl-prolyl cis-trans isomerase [Hymenobacter convexus]|uniref:FKBP-type peptidyl-prolyl cis-trans isomerase n=1 Tax=Hymenobacter sp. CA1UV-4 TaxID=3063782 RepID=UPI002712BA68|nr:FKBP-type peptidyl-prolyl cis-trans isomerase [Hymenobacter sp. CA1UV-4]MDO7852079.1 FKBP-type peptidyl-prolyl cis-trans isomerase [Hymenobacter sp. CA1UV-4]
MKIRFTPGLLRFFFLLLLGSAGMVATSCKKDGPEFEDFSAQDDGQIKNYLTSKNLLTAQKQPSGLYFLPVRTNASAKKVTLGSTVSVLYTGHLLDAAGTVFDATSLHSNKPITFVVGAGNLIPGFEEGISLMHIGDKAELLIPSGLAYGSNTLNGAIPANSVVRFEVEVLDFAVIDDNIITDYLLAHNITTAQKQASGLYFLPISTNTNAVRPTNGSTVVVQYTGHLLDAAGTVFDASTPTTPFSFAFGGKKVIAGFEEGIGLMHKGDRAELLIPSALAYGPQGSGTRIDPNSVLRFEVEVVDVR